MSSKTKLGLSLDTNLVAKLDKYRKQTRRTRSQAIETLIDNHSFDSMRLIKEQTAKIKELESDLILAKSDIEVLPEADKALIEENKRLINVIRSMKNNAQAAKDTIEKVTNIIIGSSFFNQINEILDNEQ